MSTYEKHLQKVKDNQKEKYSNNEKFNIQQRYQSRINTFFSEQKYTTNDLLGCSLSFFIRWLHFRNKTNKPLSALEIEHVIPLSSIDKTNEADVYRVFHWSNTCPLLPSDNKSKASNFDKQLEEEQHKSVCEFLELSS